MGDRVIIETRILSLHEASYRADEFDYENYNNEENCMGSDSAMMVDKRRRCHRLMYNHCKFELSIVVFAVMKERKRTVNFCLS